MKLIGDFLMLQPTPMMHERTQSTIWYQTTERLLYHSTVAIFVYFCAYILCRHTSYLTNFNEPSPEICFSKAVAASIISFGVTTMLMYSSPDAPWQKGPVFGTAILTSAGTFSGVYGHMPLVAGVLSAIFAVMMLRHGPMSFVDPFIGFIGAILSSIASSIAVGRQPDFTDDLLTRLMAGIMAVFVPVLSAYFVGQSVAVIFRRQLLNIRSIVLFSGVSAGSAAQVFDKLALTLFKRSKIGNLDIPQDYVEGLSLGLCIGLAVGVQIGYSKYYDRHFRL